MLARVRNVADAVSGRYNGPHPGGADVDHCIR